MTHETIVSEFTWQGIDIHVTYKPNYLNGSCSGDTSVLSHIEVRANQPIPITESGYKSIFFFQTTYDMITDLEQCVRQHLDEGTESKVWQKYCADQLQPSLFL